jgi:tetratricopeptide (TPR) repeat protein
MIAMLAAALLVAPAPAAAQAGEDPYAQAVSARRGGDPARAVELLQRLLVTEPENADAHLQLGLSLLALGRLDDAEAAFRRTLAIAPDYADARIGLARVAQRRDDRQGALALLEPVDPANREAGELRSALGRGGGTGTSMPGEVGSMSTQLQQAGDGRLPIGARGAARAACGGRADHRAALVEVSERFERTDGLCRSGGRPAAWARMPVFYLVVGGLPRRFPPEYQIGAGGFARCAGGRQARC